MKNSFQAEKLLRREKIVILHDEISSPPKPDELDVLPTAEWVKKNLESFGACVKIHPFRLNLVAMKTLLAKENPLLVFNLVDAVDGKCRLGFLAAALLESIEIPYTGCNNNSMFMTSDKLLAKKIMRRNGIPTADWTEDGTGAEPGVYIVKSAYEHCSIGMDDGNIVAVGELKNKIAEFTAKFGGKWFAEKYLEGREFGARLLEIEGKMEVLQPYEICYNNYPENRRRIIGHDAKCDKDSAVYNALSREFLFPENDFPLLEKINRIARECAEVFGLSGYARIDMRTDENENPLVLDINSNPSLEPEIGFFLSGEGENVDCEIIANIVIAALHHRGKIHAPA